MPVCVHCGKPANDYKIYNNQQKSSDGAYLQHWCIDCILCIQAKLCVTQANGDNLLLMIKDNKEEYRFATRGECRALRKTQKKN